MISKQRAIEAVIAYQLHCNNGLCPLCGKPPELPYRRYAPNGKVTEGCVSIHHSTTDAWANWAGARHFKRAQAGALLERWTNQELCQLDELGPTLYLANRDKTG
jgi:hypothetical protein